MDELDSKIIQLMMHNARTLSRKSPNRSTGPVRRCPAVSNCMEQEGIIGGYTVRLHHPGENNRVQALISSRRRHLPERDHFLKMIQGEP